MDLLQVYCKCVNRESSSNAVRIRPKVMIPLVNLSSQPPLKEEKQTGSYTSTLPVVGYDTFAEVFNVNSLLLLKTNDSMYAAITPIRFFFKIYTFFILDQSFHSSFVLRVQIFINSKGDQNEDNCLSLKDIVAKLKEK